MSARCSRITTLPKLRARCYVAKNDPDACWLWKGCLDHDLPAVWMLVNGVMRKVTGSVAAAYLAGIPIPERGRAWQKCCNKTCCNPAHTLTGTRRQWGAWVREQGLLRGNEKVRAAVTAAARARSAIDMDVARSIRQSDLTAPAEAERLSRELGKPVGVDLIYGVRTGKTWAEPSPFAGLGAR